MVRDEKLNPEKLRKTPGREPRHSVDQIVACLNGRELKTADLCRTVMHETGMSRAVFYRLLSEGEKGRVLSKSVITGEWEAIKKGGQQ